MNIVIKGDDSLVEAIKNHYHDQIDPLSNVPYTKFVVTNKDYKVIAYNTNKVMFQGNDAKTQASLWQVSEVDNFSTSQSLTNKNIESTIDHAYNAMALDEYIGSDEVGTGDYFGPVVVCSAYINRSLLDGIKHLNITDSKLLDDSKIQALAKELKDIIPHYIYTLDNETYNQSQPSNNLNQIKAKMHNFAIAKTMKIVGKKVPVVLDQFCQPKTYFSYLINQKTVIEDIIFETKAESKYLGVAIASILARDAFLKSMDELSNEVKTPLLKGASAQVDLQGVELVLKFGKPILNKIAKVHFANTEKINTIIKNKEI